MLHMNLQSLLKSLWRRNFYKIFIRRPHLFIRILQSIFYDAFSCMFTREIRLSDLLVLALAAALVAFTLAAVRLAADLLSKNGR